MTHFLTHDMRHAVLRVR